MKEQAGWPELVELELHGFAQGGAAVGRWQGRPVFAQGGIPGERVRVRLEERRSALARGSVVEVLRSSPARVAPPGARDPSCGGCDWQHIDYQTQLSGKQEILRDQLAHLGRLNDPHVLPTWPSTPWGYRSAARLHSAGAALGFYAAGTRRVVPLTSSPLLHPLLNQALAALQPLLPSPGLREVTLRASLVDQLVVALLNGGQPERLVELAQRWRAACPVLQGVAAVAGRGWRQLAGEVVLYEQLGGLRLRIAPTSFFQSNVALAQALLDAVREALALAPGERLLDIFCGVGTFTLPLAAGARLAAAVGVEEHPAAIADARASAQQAGIADLRFIAGRAEAVLPELSEQARFDAVLLDPPRRGVEPQALQALIQLAPRRIAYISCHPGTLARDVAQLSQAGYQLRFSRPFDFFPQTSHVESLTLLDRGAPAASGS